MSFCQNRPSGRQRGNNVKQRLAEFDIAKAIALFGVIVGHSQYLGVPSHLARFFYSFDMPLFFIISGYFLRPNDELNAQFVKKNAKALLVPYVITSSIVILIACLLAIVDPNQSVADAAQYWIRASFFGAGSITPKTPSFVPQIGAIWYLLALFLAKCYLAYANQTSNPTIFVLVAFFIGCSTTELVWLPFSIQPALGAVLFLFIGQKIRQSNVLDRITHSEWILVTTVWLFSALKYGELYMVTNTYVHGALDVIGSVFGSLAILKFSKNIASKDLILVSALCAVGRHTLPIFCMHLVELNLFPYEIIQPIVGALPLPQWITYVIARIVIIGLLAAALSFTPILISGPFFPDRKQRA